MLWGHLCKTRHGSYEEVTAACLDVLAIIDIGRSKDIPHFLVFSSSFSFFLVPLLVPWASACFLHRAGMAHMCKRLLSIMVFYPGNGEVGLAKCNNGNNKRRVLCNSAKETNGYQRWQASVHVHTQEL
jgi:hypothetical protein